MISLDQVILLEEKVENAVAKIVQLNAENAALRRKCAELTNALSAKTEQFSSFQTDQGKIEEGILKALERLNAVENAVHTATATVQASVQKQPQMPVQQADKTTEQASVQNLSEQKNTENNSIQEEPVQHSFDTATPVQVQQPEQENSVKNEESSETPETIQPSFDIF